MFNREEREDREGGSEEEGVLGLKSNSLQMRLSQNPNAMYNYGPLIKI